MGILGGTRITRQTPYYTQQPLEKCPMKSVCESDRKIARRYVWGDVAVNWKTRLRSAGIEEGRDVFAPEAHPKLDDGWWAVALTRVSWTAQT